MKILVTGGAGFIGSSLSEYLLNNTDSEVVVVDNYLTGKQQNLPVSDKFRFIKADVNDLNDIASIFQTLCISLRRRCGCKKNVGQSGARASRSAGYKKCFVIVQEHRSKTGILCFII